MIIVAALWIILLLRVHGKGLNQRNSGFGGLGMEIGSFICGQLGGSLERDRAFADWSGIKMAVDDYALPGSSARYKIPICQLPKLLSWIIQHP
jgi:hypothetical protein